jgi:serine/threonine protein phosphatase 1
LAKNKAYSPRRFAISDVHGNYKALKSVLRKSNFNYDEDHLYFLGDIADGYPEPHLCILEFLKIKHFYYCLGNHDLFLKKYVEKHEIDPRWRKMGASDTIVQLSNYINEVKWLLSQGKYYHIYEDNFLCHAGFNPKKPIIKQKNLTFCINRRLYKTSKIYAKEKYKFAFLYDDKNSIPINKVIIGHSVVKNKLPAFNANLINIDTGAANGGKLTMLDLDTYKYYQSGYSEY